MPRLRGGLLLAGEKQRASAAPLRTASVPERLLLMLEQYSGAPLQPCVRNNEPVLLGQVIALPEDARGVPLHAPVSGRILDAAHVTRAATGAIVPALLLANDGKDTVLPALHGLGDYASVDRAFLREQLAACGIVGLGGAAFPAHLKLGEGPEVVQLLLNGVECEPHISCDDALMRYRAKDIVAGGQVLLHILGAPRCTIAIEADKPEALAAIRAAITASNDPRFEAAVIPTFYPAGGERQLIAGLWGKEVPAGGLPRDVGVVCQNVGTAAAVAAVIDSGMPLVSRIVTVTGRGVQQAQNLEVRLGTPFSHLVAECGGYAGSVERLIAGGSMMGTALENDDFAVSKSTNCILVAAAADIQLRGPEVPCIRCGDCAEVCPAGLLPQELYRFVRAANDEGLDRLGLADCIECGCCDHMCPSQIPLTAAFTVARQQAREVSVRSTRAAQWRDRFAAHTERLAGAEAERQRKLKERRPPKRGDD